MIGPMRRGKEHLVSAIGWAIAAAVGIAILALQARRLLGELFGLEDREDVESQVVLFAVTAGVVATAVQQAHDELVELTHPHDDVGDHVL